MRSSNRVQVLTITAMFTALIALSTMFLRIPAGPFIFHLGDGVIYACAIIFGPITAMTAAGIGSMMANVIAGPVMWAPWTLVIKGLTGLVVGLIACGRSWTRDILAMVAGALVTIIGYAIATLYMLGPGMVLPHTWGNLAQTGVGIVIGSGIILLLKRRIMRDKSLSSTHHN